MLLIDGVRYEEWIPEKEVEEFQPIVKEHVQDIFGNKSKYIEARRLKSKAGIGSVPDGFVIIFGDPPQWHIVEVELSAHQLYDHIVNQVGRFVNGIKNPVTQKNIIETIYQEITGSKISKVEVEEAIGSGEIYKFLLDLISLSPILTIIIEKKTQELEEAINLLKYFPIKIVEFRTFPREGIGLPVHAHLFEPVREKQKQIVEVEIGGKERGEGIKKVIASDFTYKGDGIFALKLDPSITIDVKKRIRLVGEQLAKQGLWTKRLPSFYYLLRKKVGLLHTPTEG